MDAILKLIERARPMYEIIQDAVVLTDLHGKIIYVNDSYTRLLGFTKDEVLSKPCASMGLTVSFTFNQRKLQFFDAKTGVNLFSAREEAIHG